jgi:hypothetical protein
VINTYHLFSHITRERIEPEFQTLLGDEWSPHHLHYKPGALTSTAPYVAPHQPRVDFRLWFYGLAHEGKMPGYVASLLHHLCGNSTTVQTLFKTPLPESPEAARVVFWRYNFTTPEERSESGQVWKREPVGNPRGLRCGEE